MAAVLTNDIQSIPNFNCDDRSGIGPRWKRWFRAFELYCGGKGITDNDQKRALLLHTAGMDVQDIFYILPEEEGDDAYAETTTALNNYFIPQSNIPFE